MILEMDTTIETHTSGRCLIGLLVMLCSFVVLAESSARLDILPADDDEHLTNEVYNSANGWRTSTEYENDWRRGAQQQASRIQFGYDSAYEEMRAKDNNYGLDITGLGGIDHPQNTQLKISF